MSGLEIPDSSRGVTALPLRRRPSDWNRSDRRLSNPKQRLHQASTNPAIGVWWYAINRGRCKMDATNQLLTLAEISIALAGFSGIIATFQFQQKAHLSRGQVLSLSVIVIISLAAAFCSVLPLALLNFGFEERAVWSISSFLGGVFWLLGLIFTIRNIRLDAVALTTRILIGFFLALVAVASMANFLNTFGIIFDQEFGPYFAAFLYGFLLVLYNFSRLLLHPLWKVVRRQEAVIPVER